jgi:hypothetical protein
MKKRSGGLGRHPEGNRQDDHRWQESYAAGIVVNGKEQATRIAEDGTVIGRAAAKEDDDD